MKVNAPTTLHKFFQDPPPGYAFELSESGLACAKVSEPGGLRFERFDAGVVKVSPVHDNVLNREAMSAHIESLAPVNGSRRRRAALILPDYAARVAVLDFDSFPSAAEEQRALVRFRMKKTVPFDVENAMVSYSVQPRGAHNSKHEVLVAVMSNELVTGYEEPFRQAGFQPGLVTTSSLAMMNLIAPDGVTLVVKLNGSNLTAVVLDGAVIRLVRCVEIGLQSLDEIETVVLPTLAYIEDELSAAPKRILLCGLGTLGEQAAEAWAEQWKVQVAKLSSKFGAPGLSNAGLLGYLESVA